jgi:hypothetical protein
MKYAKITDDGRLTAWYDAEIHSEIPEGCVEVTEEAWQKALDSKANAYIDGVFFRKDFRSKEEILGEIQPISMRQCRLKLLSMGLLELVDTEMQKDKELSIEWEYATEIMINNPLVCMLSEKLGLNEQARVKMFEEARLL